MDTNITITGLDAVQVKLKGLRGSVSTKVLRKALQQAADIIAAEVKSRTPEGETGLLRESVITGVTIDSDGQGGKAAVGFSSAPSPKNGKPQDAIALWVEYGHVQKSHGLKSGGGRQAIGHVPAHPFIRPAADASADHAIQGFADVVGESLSVAVEE